MGNRFSPGRAKRMQEPVVRRINTLFMVSVFAVLIVAEAQARPPSGGGRGGVGRPSASFGSPGGSFGGSSFRTSPSSRWDSTPGNSGGFRQDRDNSSFGGQARSDFGNQRQSTNQERIYEHRLDQADHLRQVSEDNGNTRLSETAERMEQNAQWNYDRRNPQPESLQNQPPPTTPQSSWNGPSSGQMNPLKTPPYAPAPPERLPRTQQEYGTVPPDHAANQEQWRVRQQYADPSQPVESFRGRTPDPYGQMPAPVRTGPQSPPANPPWAVERQQFNEDRNYQHRLQQAEHLRQTSEMNGNSRLAEAGDGMQLRAEKQYMRQDRYGDSPQYRVARPSQDRYVSPSPAMTPPQTAPAPAKKSSFFDKMRGVWPFK
jgi:hypothetical protein